MQALIADEVDELSDPDLAEKILSGSIFDAGSYERLFALKYGASAKPGSIIDTLLNTQGKRSSVSLLKRVRFIHLIFRHVLICWLIFRGQAGGEVRFATQ